MAVMTRRSLRRVGMARSARSVIESGASIAVTRRQQIR
jgi:hypothetical protein